MNTAELPEEERSCDNCIYADGCRLIFFVDVCSEHKFEWEWEEDE